MQSGFQGARFKSQLALPVSDCSLLTIPFQHDIAAAIARLLSLIQPDTIRRLIIAIVVEPFQRGAFWTLAHIYKKRGEIIAPFLAHRDTAPTVIRVLRRANIKTSSLCASPTGVCASRNQSVCRQSCRQDFTMQATATQCIPARQARRDDMGSASAVALADPRPAGAESQFVRRWSQHREASERLSRQDGSRHNLGIISMFP